MENCTKVGRDYTGCLIFRKIEIPVDFICTRPWDEKYHEPRKITPMVPSSECVMAFTLGEKLDAESLGLIYEALNPSLVSADVEAIGVAIPPLVIKIAARTKNKNLAREAWFTTRCRLSKG